MDLQVILLVMISLLTINAIVVGIYIVLLLKEFNQTVKKFNGIIDAIDAMVHSVQAPVTTIANVATGLTSGLKIFSAFKSFKNDRKDKNVR